LRPAVGFILAFEAPFFDRLIGDAKIARVSEELDPADPLGDPWDCLGQLVLSSSALPCPRPGGPTVTKKAPCFIQLIASMPSVRFRSVTDEWQPLIRWQTNEILPSSALAEANLLFALATPSLQKQIGRLRPSARESRQHRLWVAVELGDNKIEPLLLLLLSPFELGGKVAVPALGGRHPFGCCGHRGFAPFVPM
jgi:hypothetical protein